jgi:hypothetical protein
VGTALIQAFLSASTLRTGIARALSENPVSTSTYELPSSGIFSNKPQALQ